MRHLLASTVLLSLLNWPGGGTAVVNAAEPMPAYREQIPADLADLLGNYLINQGLLTVAVMEFPKGDDERIRDNRLEYPSSLGKFIAQQIADWLRGQEKIKVLDDVQWADRLSKSGLNHAPVDDISGLEALLGGQPMVQAVITGVLIEKPNAQRTGLQQIELKLYVASLRDGKMEQHRIGVAPCRLPVNDDAAIHYQEYRPPLEIVAPNGDWITLPRPDNLAVERPTYLEDDIVKNPWLEVVIDGQEQIIHKKRGGEKPRVYVSNGEEYTIRLTNRNQDREYLVSLMVDGLSVFRDFEASLTPRPADHMRVSIPSRGMRWVLGPGKSIDIRGWQKDARTASAFKFVKAEDSRAGLLDCLRNIGVISAAFYPVLTEQEKGAKGGVGTGEGRVIDQPLTLVKRPFVGHEPERIEHIFYDGPTR